MIAINLVDWRSKRVVILNRRFAAIVGVAIGVWLIIAFLIFLVIKGQIYRADEGVKYLDDQLKSVSGVLAQIKDLQNQKELLQSRRKLIESFQADRPLVVNIFDNIARAMPVGVVLSTFIRKGDEITLTGIGDSNYDISVLMDNIQKLSWVKKAKLGELKTNEALQASNAAAKATAGTTSEAATNVPEQISFTLELTIDTEKAGVKNATP